MKRGFLCSSKGKAALASGNVSYAGPTTEYRVEKLAFGELNKTGPPEDHQPRKVRHIEFDSRLDTTGTNMSKVLLNSTQPPLCEGETLADQPDGWTECILTGAVKGDLLSTPGYPQRRLAHPSMSRWRISSLPLKGLGMVATRGMAAGGLIIIERPLLIGPANIAGCGLFDLPREVSVEELSQIACLEYERFLDVAVKRMQPENHEAYRALHNSHLRDGSGPLLGILRTNALRVSGLQDDLFGDGVGGAYSAVCKTMSRINHSCSPNAEYSFVKACLAFQIRACRDIRDGEEITIAYCDILNPASQRQKDLEPYGFRCTCQACSNSSQSDERRSRILPSVPTVSDIDSWVKNPALPDDYLLSKSLAQIILMETEEMQSAHLYAEHLAIVALVFVFLGNVKQAAKFSEKHRKSMLSSGMGDIQIVDMAKEEFQETSPLWGQRRVFKA